MSETDGKFVWYDVMTTDTKATETFYGHVIGWEAKDANIPSHPYTLFSMGPALVGGAMGMPVEVSARGGKPHWVGHIGVADLDASAAAVTGAGGTIDRAPEDIPGVGRFAVARDPQGAGFVLFQPKEQATTGAPVGFTPGHIGWHELHTDDVDAALAFYSSLFGWTKGDALDMGPMGIYQIFAIPGSAGGGIMARQPGSSGPFWLFYINIDGIDAGAARVTKEGGQIINGPHEVPGGSWILQCLDPQGAMFALVSPTR